MNEVQRLVEAREKVTAKLIDMVRSRNEELPKLIEHLMLSDTGSYNAVITAAKQKLADDRLSLQYLRNTVIDVGNRLC
ncbi:hypothetical protein BLD44_028390 [Mastigocladus laminosus UU774]|nr:hypothetical protein BLD44_028390 [Mastigocladus laminosus UU774]